MTENNLQFSQRNETKIKKKSNSKIIIDEEL